MHLKEQQGPKGRKDGRWKKGLVTTVTKDTQAYWTSSKKKGSAQKNKIGGNELGDKTLDHARGRDHGKSGVHSWGKKDEPRKMVKPKATQQQH